MANNIQVRDALGALLTMRTLEQSGVHTPYQTVGSVEKKFRDSFPGPSIDPLKWDTVVGTGGNATITAGQLVLGSGNTANSETYVMTKETFYIPFRISFSLTLSQRIANQSFYVEAVSVDPVTGLPDGIHSCGWLFDGTSATIGKYVVQSSGLAPLVSAASTVVTTANGTGHFEVEPFADEAWFHSGVLDANTGRANSYRRHQQIPDPNALYKIRVRWLNGATAPASNTNASLQFVAIQDYQELTAEITAGRGQTSAGQAMAAAVVSMPTTTVTGTVTANAIAQNSIFFNETTTNLAAGATFTGTSRDTGVAAGAVHRYNMFYGYALASHPGTFRIELSNNNTNWFAATDNMPVAANVPMWISTPIATRYHRVVFINGATAQTSFIVNSAYNAV